jgi:2-amino-4-hydroxy-6-hydroxymethyldihydropteridine diphosphokinase
MAETLMGGRVALIGLGSNRRHGRLGRPEAVVLAAVAALADAGLAIEAVSGVRATAPMGPGGRRFANAVVRGRWAGEAADLLAMLKAVEQGFGRRGGRRWGDRVLDLDLLALGEGVWRTPGLSVPHPGLAARRFVLDPLVEVAPGWRHPLLGWTARQLRARAMRPKGAAGWGP